MENDSPACLEFSYSVLNKHSRLITEWQVFIGRFFFYA